VRDRKSINVEENVLRGIAETTRGFRAAHSILLIALFLAAAVAPGAGAGTTTPKSIELPARVIAHLPLATPPGNQMVLQKQGDKRYLYIQRESKQGYIIVEVTQPEFASFVIREAPSNANDSTTARIEVGGQDVPEVPDAASKTSIRSIPGAAETVKVLDVSDPEHPTTLQTLKNVTSFLADGSRGIFYVTNDDGLWVLKHNREQIKKAEKKPPCNLRPDAPVIQDCE